MYTVYTFFCRLVSFGFSPIFSSSRGTHIISLIVPSKTTARREQISQKDTEHKDRSFVDVENVALWVSSGNLESSGQRTGNCRGLRKIANGFSKASARLEYPFSPLSSIPSFFSDSKGEWRYRIRRRVNWPILPSGFSWPASNLTAIKLFERYTQTSRGANLQAAAKAPWKSFRSMLASFSRFQRETTLS